MKLWYEGNYNAMHDKSLYEIEYTDGTMQQPVANIIADNMMSQVDSEGHNYQVLTEVTDQNKDDSAIANVSGFIKSSSGNLHRNRTTRVWKLLVEWKDVSFDWVPLTSLLWAISDACAKTREDDRWYEFKP